MAALLAGAIVKDESGGLAHAEIVCLVYSRRLEFTRLAHLLLVKSIQLLLGLLEIR